MTIYFFRNKLDGNMKRFGKFSKDIQNKLCNTFEVKLICSSRKMDYISKFNSENTYIIIAHGSPETIYHRFKNSQYDHQVLLDTTSFSDNKNIGKIIAISCNTARVLGRELVRSGQCKVYLGFDTKLHFDKRGYENSFVSPYYSREIKQIYKTVFEKVLTIAIKEAWSFDKLEKVLDYELRKYATERLKEIKTLYPHYYEAKDIGQILVAVSSVANGITLIGNGKEKVV